MKKLPVFIAIFLFLTSCFPSIQAADLAWLRHLPLLESYSTPPDQRGQWTELSLYRGDRELSHALIRVERTYGPHPRTGEEKLLHTHAMAAGTLLVGLEQNVRRPDAQSAIESIGGTVKRWLGHRAAIVEFAQPDLHTLEKKRHSLWEHPDIIRYIENDFYLSDLFPDLPLIGNPSPSNSPSQGKLEPSLDHITLPHQPQAQEGEDENDFDLWHHDALGLDEAWKYSDGKNVIVAMIEDGFNTHHVDIKPNFWSNLEETNGGILAIDDDNNGFIDDFNGWDFASDDNNVHLDGATHGTWTSVVLGAIPSAPAPGVAPRVQIMPLKISSSPLKIKVSQLSGIIDAYFYAVDNGAMIICPGFTLPPFYSLQEAAGHAADHDVLIVNGSGNDHTENKGGGTRFEYPASFYGYGYHHVIAAGGHRKNLTWYGDFSSQYVTIAAPAHDIITSEQPNDYYEREGTSYSAPIISGVAALVLSLRPELEATELAHLIKGYGITTPLFDLFCDTGKRVYAANLVRASAPGTVGFVKNFYSISESDPDHFLEIEVERDGAQGFAEVHYSIIPLSATEGQDFSGTNGSLKWAFQNGQIVKPANGIISDWNVFSGKRTITIPIFQDMEHEGVESFGVVLTDSQGAAIDSDRDTVLIGIFDDENPSNHPGTLEFKNPHYALNEGDSIKIIIERRDGNFGEVSAFLDWYPPQSNPASKGHDYTLDNQNLVWADGDFSQKEVTLTALKDDKIEPSEYILLGLKNIQGGALKGEEDKVSIRIKPNTPTQTIQFLSPQIQKISEGQDVVLPILREGGDSGLVSAWVRTVDGTAIAGEDYIPFQEYITWNDGDDTMQWIDFKIINDGKVEPDETLLVEIVDLFGFVTMGEPHQTLVTIEGEFGAQNQEIKIPEIANSFPLLPLFDIP